MQLFKNKKKKINPKILIENFFDDIKHIPENFKNLFSPPSKSIENKAYFPSPTVTSTPTSTPTPTPMPTPVPDEYEKMTMETFDKYEIPRSVAYGIGKAEGGVRNRFNIGAHDSNPTGAPIWGELETATKAAKMLSGTANPEFYGAGEKGKKLFRKAFEQRANPEKMLELIRDAGYAGDPKTWKSRSLAEGGAGKYYDTWDEFVRDTDPYKKWSQ